MSLSQICYVSKQLLSHLLTFSFPLTLHPVPLDYGFFDIRLICYDGFSLCRCSYDAQHLDPIFLEQAAFWS